jgi:glycerol-3-phosphate dehydrogenase
VEDKDNYERDRLPIADFAESARKYLPELRDDDLRLAYSGLRPKLTPPGTEGMADFVITKDINVPQAIHLIGIDSPGLTAAPSIARQVADLVQEILN